RLPRAMVRNGRTGWYYRVLEPGTIAAGDPVACIERPHPDMAFERLIEIVNYRKPTRAELDAMAAMAGLANDVREGARPALQRGV
ncbi:MAG: MOSC domain-containing protein, partial [Sphingomonas bacterium]|nr:MOSC domain-containing protein [Sphingomonas bacterium]